MEQDHDGSAVQLLSGYCFLLFIIVHSAGSPLQDNSFLKDSTSKKHLQTTLLWEQTVRAGAYARVPGLCRIWREASAVAGKGDALRNAENGFPAWI